MQHYTVIGEKHQYGGLLCVRQAKFPQFRVYELPLADLLLYVCCAGVGLPDQGLCAHP